MKASRGGRWDEMRGMSSEMEVLNAQMLNLTSGDFASRFCLGVSLEEVCKRKKNLGWLSPLLGAGFKPDFGPQVDEHRSSKSVTHQFSCEDMYAKYSIVLCSGKSRHSLAWSWTSTSA